MHITVKESIQKASTEAQSSQDELSMLQNALDTINSISSLDELIAYTTSDASPMDKSFFDVPRENNIYSYIAYPITDKLFLLIMFYLRNDHNLDMMSPVMYSIDNTSYAYGDISELADASYIIDSRKNEFNDKYYFPSFSEIKYFVGLEHQSKAMTDDEIASEFTSKLSYYMQKYLFTISDYALELFFDDIKKHIISNLTSMLDRKSRFGVSNKVAIDPSGVDYDALIKQMHDYGGELEVQGLKGLLLEHYSSNSYPMVRTNDGTNGLHDIHFPMSLRSPGALYLVPASFVKYNRTLCRYMLSASADIDKCKIK